MNQNQELKSSKVATIYKILGWTGTSPHGTNLGIMVCTMLDHPTGPNLILLLAGAATTAANPPVSSGHPHLHALFPTHHALIPSPHAHCPNPYPNLPNPAIPAEQPVDPCAIKLPLAEVEPNSMETPWSVTGQVITK